MQVYQIEECGRSYIGHWFQIMLPSLQHVVVENDSEKIKLCLSWTIQKNHIKKNL